MPKRAKTTAADPTQRYLLTINQAVSYNLARARRSRGWTQEETAERLQAVSGKRWTAATLSASERAVATSRPRIFDANELITFSRVFAYPVAYFLLPVERPGIEPTDFYYRLHREPDEAAQQSGPLLSTEDLLYTVVPLKYPGTFVDTVNRLLESKGIVWQPTSRVEWTDGSDFDYETSRYLEHRYEKDPVSLDDWKVIEEFAALANRMPAEKLFRLLGDAMGNPPQGNDEGSRASEQQKGGGMEDPPF
ncbi:helix-turn-helix domain-containing protein [Streptomyces leeuwenhoekii]|uniref:helix-turn-helix domain-containing protein n=1 Tax=Streptomyces leeuwenhoekii TaxID=1437453 RepID=UPI00131C8969|nr:helix-turn-helix transcriptional regulator [Streptomyces leeuwenhoekii]